MAEIRSKQEFYRLWLAGCLGNRLRVWRTLEEWRAEDRSGTPVTLRVAHPSGGGSYCTYDLRPNAVDLAYLNLRTYGIAADRIFIHEGAPDHKQTIQGEVCRLADGWHGYIGRSGTRMRYAMAAGHLRPVRGLAVKDALDRYMNENARDDLEAILDLYPDATVEFTCYSRELGILPRRNAVIWEVRNY